MKERVTVVMGGPSSEAEISRLTGNAILKALREKGYEAQPLELDPKNLAQDLKKSDCQVVFNAVHGRYGEDGLLRATADLLSLPCTSSGVMASAITMDKVMTKRIFLSAGINTPQALFYKKNTLNEVDICTHIMEEFSFPLVVKAPDQGSSIGVYIVKTKEELEKSVKEAFSYGEQILVEEFIKGKELTVAVICKAEKKALPIIEIVANDGLYDYHNKYTKGASHHIIPARIDEKVAAQIEKMAIDACDVTACSGVARVDFLLSEDNIPYALEINTVPGMTELSLVPDAARAAGISFPELCEMILRMAIEEA